MHQRPRQDPACPRPRSYGHDSRQSVGPAHRSPRAWPRCCPRLTLPRCRKRSHDTETTRSSRIEPLTRLRAAARSRPKRPSTGPIARRSRRCRRAGGGARPACLSGDPAAFDSQERATARRPRRPSGSLMLCVAGGPRAGASRPSNPLIHEPQRDCLTQGIDHRTPCRLPRARSASTASPSHIATARDPVTES
jgi:hypothetical protein